MSDDTEEIGAAEARKNQYRAEYAGLTLEQLIGKMAEAKAAKEALEERLKNANAAFDVLRLELVPNQMEEQGIERLTIKGIGRVSLTADAYVSNPANMREQFFNWLREHNLDDLIKETINSSTLKAFVLGRVKKGEPLPTECLNITPFTRASITKG